TIQAGVVVAFAKSDPLHAGMDGTQVELTVDGALDVAGTADNPVVFRSQSGSPNDSWYGVVIGDGASAASVTGAVFRDGQFGIRSSMTASPLAVSQTVVRDVSNTGIWVYAGTANIDAVTIVGTFREGIMVGSGITTTPVSATITNGVF